VSLEVILAVIFAVIPVLAFLELILVRILVLIPDADSGVDPGAGSGWILVRIPTWNDRLTWLRGTESAAFRWPKKPGQR
jgi:hypothetical protein